MTARSNIIKFADRSPRVGKVTQASTVSIPQSNLGILQPPMGYDTMQVLNGRVVAIQSNPNLAKCYPPIYYDTINEVWKYIINPTNNEKNDPNGAA